jgi:hypothetical protein
MAVARGLVGRLASDVLGNVSYLGLQNRPPRRLGPGRPQHNGGYAR